MRLFWTLCYGPWAAIPYTLASGIYAQLFSLIHWLAEEISTGHNLRAWT